NLPPLPEQKISEAIRHIGGTGVTVRRVIRGQIRDDSQDLFVLEGKVPNQLALTRIPTVASQSVAGPAAGADQHQDIQAPADEAAGGRILSIVDVIDLPQVRVDIRLLEVNRSTLRSFSSNLTGLIGSAHAGSFTPTTGNGAVPKIGPSATVENILGFLGGTLS